MKEVFLEDWWNFYFWSDAFYNSIVTMRRLICNQTSLTLQLFPLSSSLCAFAAISLSVSRVASVGCTECHFLLYDFLLAF